MANVIKRLVVTGLSLLSILLPLAAHTQDTEYFDGAQDTEAEAEHDGSYFYLGLMAGNADMTTEFDASSVFDGIKYEQSQDEQGFGLYSGFNFADVWSLEGMLFIVMDMQGRPSELPIDDVYLTVITLTPSYHFHIYPSWSLFVKAGLGVMIYTEDYDKHGEEFSHSDSDYWTGIGFSLGAGTQFDITDNIAIRLSYDYVEAELESDDNNHHPNLLDVDQDFELVSFGIHYQF
ncbi:outer membrane beta-barrel protein [Thalassotalea sp. Y01]|uniref:outer membrane protein n=1 Tax=Thalassotalea sp. Y01 TaxID=2729613 RepID=UPI00145F87E4|nr:outer membrane beta-barrel protein [Thalassotalea sp. Y01]NMP15631.1 porin family protein [Thalassotalea sp. Y01]